MQNVDGLLTLMANDPSWRHLMANAPSWRHLMANDPINEKGAQNHVCTCPRPPCTRHAKWRKANRNKNVDVCLTLMAHDPSRRHTSSDDQTSSSSVQCPSLGRVSGAPKKAQKSSSHGGSTAATTVLFKWLTSWKKFLVGPSAMFAFDGTLAIEMAVSSATNCSHSLPTMVLRSPADAPAAPPSTMFNTLELSQKIVQYVPATQCLKL